MTTIILVRKKFSVWGGEVNFADAMSVHHWIMMYAYEYRV